jgi:hypothetical protein
MRGMRTIHARTCRTAGCRWHNLSLYGSLRRCPSCGRLTVPIRGRIR